MDNNIIETFDLTKIYTLKGKKKAIKAINNINISIKEGEIFGLLGPNGAGKTTTISILTTLLQPTSGYALIDGYDILKKPKHAKAKISLMLESDILYHRLTGYDNLKFFCKIYKVPKYKEKIYKKAKEFGIEKWLKQYVEKFSSGMKMKLALCRTLLLERPILFLDEPTIGLDVKTTSFIVDKLKELNSTIFLTSHNMSVVEKLCDRIAFINKGNIIKIGTKEDIAKVSQSAIDVEIKISENKETLKSEIEQQEFTEQVLNTKEGLIISLKNREYYSKLLEIISKYKIRMIKELDFSLEDLFLKII
ncbi:MAG: ABC transporter ATP-binding protein [Promethearchaeota archaeon]